MDAPRSPTYDEIAAIARLVEASAGCSAFYLRWNGVEVEWRRPPEAPPRQETAPR